MRSVLSRPDTFERFIDRYVAMFAADAWAGFKALGRGILFVFLVGEDGFKTRYSRLEDMRQMGFSDEVLGYARGYDTGRESVICVDTGEGLRFLKATLDRATDGAAWLN